MDDRARIGKRDPTTAYHGWLVVAAAFLIAMYGFGLGFYGPGIYLVALNAHHGWSTAELSSAITAYYILGAALLFFGVGPLFDRHGARAVVMIGTAALCCGVVSLTLVARQWQVYAAFAAMSVGWATMSGAAINIIVAPWFDRRRGLAVSWSLNGASAGGVVIVPLLTFLIARVGLAIAVEAMAASMLAILIPVAALILRPRRPDEHDRADAVPASGQPAIPSRGLTLGPRFHLPTVLRSNRFVTTSAPFALGLTAQVGFLTHQIAFLSPMIGASRPGNVTVYPGCLSYFSFCFSIRIVAVSIASGVAFASAAGPVTIIPSTRPDMPAAVFMSSGS